MRETCVIDSYYVRYARRTARNFARVGLFAAAVSAFAQAPALQDPIKLGPFTIGGSIRARVENWEWFKGNADNSYTYSGNMFRLGIGQQGEKMEWQLEFELPLLAGLPDHAVAPGAQGQLGLGATYFVSNDKSTTAALPFAKQGFIRFKRVGAPGSSLKLGRFEFIDGNEVTPKNATLAAI